MSINRKIVSIAMLPDLHEMMKTAAEAESKSVSALVCEACEKLLVELGFSEDPDGLSKSSRPD